jgi:hypothetical protein
MDRISVELYFIKTAFVIIFLSEIHCRIAILIIITVGFDTIFFTAGTTGFIIIFFFFFFIVSFGFPCSLYAHTKRLISKKKNICNRSADAFTFIVTAKRFPKHPKKKYCRKKKKRVLKKILSRNTFTYTFYGLSVSNNRFRTVGPNSAHVCLQTVKP